MMEATAQEIYNKTNDFVTAGFNLLRPVSQRNEREVSAMEAQWEFFVSNAKDKADSHTRTARYWDRIDTFFGLSLIFLSASITAMALLENVPKEVVAGIGAVSTMLAAAASFLKSSDRRQLHEKSSRNFRSLMVKMLSCETEKDYEKLWADFNREITDEPIMPKRFAKTFKPRFTMTPELKEVVEEKELAIAKLEHLKVQEIEATRVAVEKAEEEAGIEYKTPRSSPTKEKWMSVIQIPDITTANMNISHKILT